MAAAGTLHISIHPTAMVDPTVVFRGSGTIEIGAYSRVDAFTVITVSPRYNVLIRRCVHIGAQSTILGGGGPVLMEDFSGTSPGARIFTSSDRFKGGALLGPCVAEEFRDAYNGPVIFRWCAALGAGCTVLPGVTLGYGALAAAHSVLIKSVPACQIVSGVPAKRIGMRDMAVLQANMAGQTALLQGSPT